jgi:hypothetical protein
MKMKHVCLMDLGYDGPFTFVRSQEGPGGTGYGNGEGSARGPRLNGSVRWASHPRRRDDGVMLPHGEGVITTDDGATILFTLHGRTVTLQKDGGEKGGQLLHVLFETGDERYAWMNRAVCVAEGVIDPGSLRLVLGVHECVNEMLEHLQ